MNGVVENPTKPYDLFNGKGFDTTLQLPNLEKLKDERYKRNDTFLRNLIVNDADRRTSKESILQENAAITIQRNYRGYLGRKQYFELLYENTVKGEQSLLTQQHRQVVEGEILIESYKIERELEETDAISRNKCRHAHANATIIQRAWREHRSTSSKEHICCACNDDYPDLYAYYSETHTICFCCEMHRGLTNKERISLALNDDEFLFDEDHLLSSPAYLPSPSVDWLSISSVLNNKSRSGSGVSSIDFEDLRNRLDVDHDVKLTFVESYESDNNNNHEVEIFNSNLVSNDYVSIDIEKVTDPKRKRSSDVLEPVEESTRVLKSLEIHQEHEVKRENIERIKKLSTQVNFFDKTLDELKKIIQDLENSISEKNLELLKELMMRDDLYTRHEALLMDADDLAKKEKA